MSTALSDHVIRAPAELNPELNAAAELVGSAKDVTLVAHVQPDADALGSALALGLALRQRGATVRVTFGEPAETPDSLRGLDVANLIVSPNEVPAEPELLIALDTASRARLGCLADRVNTSRAVLVVDHHATSERFGTHHLVDPQAEATAVLALRLIDALDARLDEAMARCLYAGLVTDTSCFRRADEGTHAIAARLLAAGVDSNATTRELMDTHPFGWLNMLATVLGRARLESTAAQGMGLVHTTVLLSDAVGMRSEEVESVVDLVRTTAEAEVAAVLKEIATDQWSVSLRAKQRLDIAAAATELGGGGHRLAAGFTTTGTVDDVLSALRTALHRAPSCE
ncbi:MAG: DHH family phosphoesterase [Pseudonocardiaceae bacterium]